ncbi:MAG: YebC/PmpR family DNA-binding transcriptional regulator [Patescibacteria group bacterium]
MSGHSKWAQIKRKKGITDVKRGKLFSKIARTIIIAARAGDRNPSFNPKLQTAIEYANSVNMPRDVIDRALVKAAGTDEKTLEEFLYEAYGAEGVALIIEGVTDNKNRSTQEIKHLLLEHGGKLANPGTVQWLFEKRAVLEIPLSVQTLSRDEIELIAIDSGAESIESDEGSLIVWTKISNAESAKTLFKTKNVMIGEISNAYTPLHAIKVSQKAEESIAKLIDALEDGNDVQNVYTNINV